jgi:hypothetical protein
VQLDAVSGANISGHDAALSAIVIQRKLHRRPCVAPALLPASIEQYPTRRPTHRPNHVWEG